MKKIVKKIAHHLRDMMGKDHISSPDSRQMVEDYLTDNARSVAEVIAGKTPDVESPQCRENPPPVPPPLQYSFERFSPWTKVRNVPEE